MTNSTNVKYLISAAEHSRYNAKHWFRYLRKMIVNDKVLITDAEINTLYQSNQLTNFQKVTLKHAMVKGTPTYNFVTSLNKKCKLRYIEEFFRRNPDAAERREDEAFHEAGYGKAQTESPPPSR